MTVFRVEKTKDFTVMGISSGQGFYTYGEGDLENEEKQRDRMILRILEESE